jgi:agmatine deiminase
LLGDLPCCVLAAAAQPRRLFVDSIVVRLQLTPMASRAKMPAEWERHRATWLAWPSHADLWLEDLAPARREFVALCRGIAHGAAESLEVLVLDRAGEREAAAALAGLDVRFHVVRFGDIWLRDTAPTFVRGAHGELVAVRFRFNGWGGKVRSGRRPGSRGEIATLAGARVRSVDLVLEGGAVEVDGVGTCITTRQCALSPSATPVSVKRK